VQRSSGVGDRERRPLSIARLGAALVAVLVGAAAGQTTATTDAANTSGAVFSLAASYAEPSAPGGAFRLRVDAPPESQVLLLVTRGPALATDDRILTAEELGSAILLPVALDPQGDLDLQAFAPAGVSLESLRESRLRFRVVLGLPGIATPLITDPVPLVSAAPQTTALAGTTTTTATTGALATASPATTTTTATTATTSPATTTTTATATTSVSTSTVAGSVVGSDGPNETDSATAPPPPSSTKAGAHPSSSVSVPLPSNLTVRFLTQFTLVSATHDQPSPIQGSGH
jgi:hypothetical protein